MSHISKAACALAFLLIFSLLFFSLLESGRDDASKPSSDIEYVKNQIEGSAKKYSEAIARAPKMLPSPPEIGFNQIEQQRDFGQSPEESFLEEAIIKDERISPPNANSIYTVERLIEHPSFKIPLLRVVETFRIENSEKKRLHRIVSAADRVLVRLPINLAEPAVQALAKAMNCEVERDLKMKGVYVFKTNQRVTLETVPVILAMTESDANAGGTILLAEPEFLYFASAIPGDPKFNNQWALHNMGQGGGTADADIDGPSAWDISTDASAVTIAVIDSGIDKSHVDLADNIWRNPNETVNGIDDDNNGYIDDIWGWDFYANDNDPDDENRHGTHCAGIIGARGNNGIGIAGTAWNARIASLRFLSSGGAGSLSDAIDAVNYSKSNGFEISSNSWGGGGYSQLLYEAINETGAQGALFVAAAGNAATNIDRYPTYPAAYDSDAIIAVASTDSYDGLSNFSNYGVNNVDIAAPGSSIYSTLPNDSYGYLSGTSMAAPFVSGAIGLLSSLRPDLNATELKAALLASSDPIESLKGDIAHGRLNLAVLLNDNSGALPQIKSMLVDDGVLGGGNDDGILSPGESISLYLKVKNVGVDDIASLSLEASIVETSGEVIVTQSLSNFNGLNSGAIIEGSSPIRLAISATVQTPKRFNLRLTMRDGADGEWTEIHPLDIKSVYSLSGTVKDDISDLPIENAKIRYGAASADFVTTQADGSYTLQLVDGSYTMYAEAGGYVPSELQQLSLPPQPTTSFNFRLGKSEIDIQPSSLSASLNQGQSTGRQLTVTNNGNRQLNYTIHTVYDLASYLGASASGGDHISLFEDFEAGSLSDWTLSNSNITAELTSATKVEGASSLHLTSNYYNAHRLGLYRDLASDARPSHIKFNVRSGSTETNDAYFLLYDRSNYQEIISFYASADGTFKINANRATQPNFPYEAKRWYTIEFRDINWDNGTLDFAVDGVVISNNVPFQSTEANLHGSRVYLYNYSNDSEAWWDHIVAGEGEAGWINLLSSSGSIAPGSSDLIDVTLGSSILQGGQYTANIVFNSNAPGQPTTTIPVTLNIEQIPNTAPVAESFTVTMDEDTAHLITLRASDADGHSINAKIETIPTTGTLYQVLSDGTRGTAISQDITYVIHRNLELIYVPKNHASGSPLGSFSYSVTDGKATSNTGTVTLNVTEVNDPPVARADFASTAEGAAIPVIRVLANDTDADGDTLQITSISTPDHGTAIDNGDGTISYAPNPEFLDGIDSFSYTISDGRGGSSVAEVVIRSGASAGGDWPMFGGNAQHTGEYPATLGTGEFKLAWTLPGTSRLNQAVIVKNRIYTTPYVRFDYGAVQARDISTGSLIWENGFEGYNAPNSINPPAFYENRIYVQRGNHSSDTQLWSIDAVTGETVWKASHASQWERYLAPTINENGIYINGGGYGGMYGFNHDGTQKFFRNLAQVSDWTPAIDNNNNVYSWTGSTLRQHDHATGLDNWSLTVSGKTTAVISGNLLVGYGGGILYVVDTDLAQILWQKSGSFYGLPAISNGIVYIHSRDAFSNPTITGFALNDGTLIREYPMMSGSIQNDYQPIVTQDRLIASNSASTRVFDLSTGSLLQELPYGGHLSFGSSVLSIANYPSSSEPVILAAYRFAGTDSTTPIANNASFQGTEDTQLPLPLTGQAANGSPVFPVVTSLPFRGTLYQTGDGNTPATRISSVPTIVENSQGHLIYIPDPDGFGDNYDTFEFKVSDGYIASESPATATIHITGTPDAPVAHDDIAVTSPGHSIPVIRVLANDVDVDNDTLELESFETAQHGTLTNNGDGTLSYTPDADFTDGSDFISYTVSDGTGLSDVGLIEIRMGATGGVEWPMLGANPQHSSFLPISPEATGWVEAWSRPVNQSPNPVAIANGKVYVTPYVYFNEAYIAAYDLISGAEYWRFNFPEYKKPFSINPPAYSDGKIFVQRGNHSSDSQLWSFSADTGEPLWNTPFSAQWERYNAPTIADGKIWVNGGSYGGMYGYDAETGTQLFFKSLGQESNWTPAYSDKTIYECVRGLFQAHDPVSGDVLWSLRLSESESFSRAAQVTIAENRALVVTAKGLFCIRLDLNIVAWRTETVFNSTKAYPTIAGNSVYVGVGSKVIEYSLFTGKILGEFDTQQTNAIVSQSIATNNLLIAASSNKTFIFDRYSRNLAQTLQIGGDIALGNNRLLVASSAEGTLTAFTNVTISGPNNEVPVAHSAEVDIQEDSQVTVKLEGNDADGDTLLAVVTSLPGNGRLFQTNNGLEPTNEITSVPTMVQDSESRVIFVPDEDKNGTPYASFNFTVQDAISISATEASVIINVAAVNDAPIAYSDYITLRPSQSMAIIQPTANDLDIDGDTLNLISFTQVGKGQVERVDAATLHYYPDDSLDSYETSFSYTITDAAGVQSTATIFITVDPDTGTNWPTYGANMQHTHYQPLNIGQAPWLPGIDIQVDTAISELCIVDGVAYISYGTSDTCYIEAIDLTSGGSLWRSTYPLTSGPGRNPVLYYEGKLYLQTRDHSGTNLLCVDAETGEILWDAPAGEQWDNHLAPVADETGIYVQSGYYGGMRAYNFDGSSKFSVSLPQVNYWTPTLDVDGKLYSWDERAFREHDKSTGETLWSFTDPDSSYAYPYRTAAVIDSGIALIQGGNRLNAVDLTTQTSLWSMPTGIDLTPATAKGWVYQIIHGPSPSTHYELQKMNLRSGKVALRINLGSFLPINSPVITNDAILLSDANNTRIYSISDGSLWDTIPVGGYLVIANDSLCFSTAGRIVTYGRPTPNNQPPVAQALQTVTDEDTQTTVQLLGSDPDGDDLRFVITSLPDKGTLYQTIDGVIPTTSIEKVPTTVSSASGQLIFIPQLDGNGDHYGDFNFLVRDDYTTSDEQLVQLDVSPIDDAPVGLTDTIIAAPGEIVTPLYLIDNDFDVDGDTLSIVSYTQGAIGQVEETPFGRLSYIAPIDTTATEDSFTYLMTDSVGAAITVQVNVHIVEDSSDTWAGYGDGPAHQGAVNVTLPRTDWNRTWLSSDIVTSAQPLAIAQGLVFVAPSIYHSTAKLHALDQTTGAVVWTHDFGSAARINAPAWFNGRLYVQIGNHSSSSLHCLDATTGNQIWEAPYSEQWEEHFAPAVTSDGIWINGGSYGGLYGFDLDGTRRFFTSLAQYDEWTPAIDSNGKVYSWVGGSFACHDPNSGAVLWSLPIGWNWHGWSMNTVPVVSQGLGFVRGSPGIHCINLGGRALRWTAPGNFSGTPAIGGGMVYALKSNTVKALRIIDGQEAASYQSPNGTSLIDQPLITNSHVFASDGLNTYVFDRATANLVQTQ